MMVNSWGFLSGSAAELAVWFEVADGNGAGPGRVRRLPLDPDTWLDRACSLWMVLSMSVIQTLRSSELTSRWSAHSSAAHRSASGMISAAVGTSRRADSGPSENAAPAHRVPPDRALTAAVPNGTHPWREGGPQWSR